jgi:methionyl aminopeptidase
MVFPGAKTLDIDKKCADICSEEWVLCGFKWVYWFPAHICISINNSVVHWYARVWQTLKHWDVVKLDFWVKDKVYQVNTDAAITMIVWDWPHNPNIEKMLEANKKALYAWIAKARAWNRVWDIGHAIQKEIEWPWFHVVRDLTGHWVWKTLHERPYIPNYWKKGKWEKIKKGMTLAIEPILWQTSWKIYDTWNWDIYIKDWSIWTQFEHTILITDWEAEIIV